MQDNGAMPLLDPFEAMPEGAVRAQAVTSVVSRIEMARYLGKYPRSTRQQIAAGAGLKYETVRKEIALLVELGYVTTSGGRRHETYTLDGVRLSADLGALIGYISQR